MAGKQRRQDVAPAATEPVAGGPERFSRRQAIGRVSVVATAGAVAWVAPQILTAKPADGAVLSGTATEDGTLNPNTLPAAESGASTGTTPDPVVTLAQDLAFTGLNLQRDAAIGVALVGGGWVMHHWASRHSPQAADGATGSKPSAPSSSPE